MTTTTREAHETYAKAPRSHRWAGSLPDLYQTLRRETQEADGQDWRWRVLRGGAVVGLRARADLDNRLELRIARAEPVETEVQQQKWDREVATFLQHFRINVVDGTEPADEDTNDWIERPREPEDEGKAATRFLQMRTGERAADLEAPEDEAPSLKERPYVFLDAETTGTDPYTDRIVKLTLIEHPSGQEFTSLVNPGVPIPPDATKIHGITDEMVKDAPPFGDLAPMVQKVVEDGVPVTYNGRRFDTPLIDAELQRAGHPGLPRDEIGRIVHPEIDIYQVLMKKEPRTLEAVYERFVGKPLENAHDSQADTEALPDLLEAICEAFGLESEDAETLVALTRPDEEIDRAGKFRKEGDVAVFNFGNHKDEPVKRHLDYVEWMLTRDFPPETKAVGRFFLEHFRSKGDGG